MTGGRGFIALLAAAMLGVAPASAPAAQQDAARAALERFAAQLEAADDTVALRRLERDLKRSQQDPEAEAFRRLRRGYVRLRLGALGDGWSYGRAAGDFRAAGAQFPGWALPAYQEGLAWSGEARWKAGDRRNLGKRIGFGALESAYAAFELALAREPGHGPSLVALYRTGLALRDSAMLADAVLPAIRAGAASPRDTAVLLALGRLERTFGDSLASLAAFRSYLAAGGAPGVGLRELAWTGFIAGRPEADSAYYAGAAVDDSAGVAAYREDLALVADSAELAAFDTTLGDGRADWLRRFWSDRGRLALRTPEERLREHYRRITVAERNYLLEVNRRHYAFGDIYRSGGARFDDRGAVFIRYGEPDERAATVTFGIQPNESWRYFRADGDLLLHFAANPGGDIGDLRLIPSVFQVGGVGDPTAAATWFALDQRCRIYGPYCKYLGWGPYGREKIAREERAIGLASAAVAVSSDGFEPRFARSLDAHAAAFAVGRADSGGLTLVHFAFDVVMQLDDSVGGPAVFRVPVAVRLNLTDSAGRSVAWVDSTAVLGVPATGPGVVHALGRVEVPVPEGRWYYRAALGYGDSTGRVFPTGGVTAGRFDGSRLEVSDLVLARQHWGALWVPAPGDSAWFTPHATWAREDTVAVYHEIYGLRPGSAYRSQLTVRRGRRPVLSLTWNETAAGPVTRVTRTLSAGSLTSGEYELEIEVIGADGAKAVARRAIVIED